jgi:hypothetical protein
MSILRFFSFIMSHKLFNHPTSCSSPAKLTGLTWDKLDPAALACPPEVSVAEHMVAISTGATVRLACLVAANAGAKLK